MVERRKPIPVAEAISRLYEYRKYGEAEFVPIENCFGRFLGTDIVATHPVPPFDRSPYDGYALRSMDTLQATREKPVWFEVKGTVGAGSVYPEKVGPFEAVRIMTGAQIPSGCDAVIMLEATKEIEKDGRTLIQIKKPIQKGTNI
ncbi:MAG TPA: molybdopterin molybdenumtransferase MoeA, partial [Bacillota bacterium]|nr:molybdopterin molybdenumtransferase MoeA [Bacillota bacterium]